MMKKIWLVVIALVLIIAFFLIKPSFSGSVVNEEMDIFAQCLTENGFKMYGTEWCSHCQNQKKLFGRSFKLIDYIDCDRNKNLCLSNGVKGYPTWKINGENYSGEQSLERLAQLSGCEL